MIGKPRTQNLVSAFLLLAVVAGSVFAEKKSTKRTSASVTSSKNSGEYIIEKRSDGSTVKYKKKTTYDFEGVGIDGISNKPSGSYVSNIKDVKAKSIIRMRENFDAEVIDSSRQMK